MINEPSVQYTLVIADRHHDGRWSTTLGTPMPAGVLDPAGLAPSRLTATIQETRTGAIDAVGNIEPGWGQTRTLDVELELLGTVNGLANYVPTPGQHLGDEPWPMAAVVILAIARPAQGEL